MKAIFALVALLRIVLPVEALGAADPCKNAQAYDKIAAKLSLAAAYQKSCSEIVKANTLIDNRVRASKIPLPGGGAMAGDSQQQQFQQMAAVEAAGSQSKEQVARVAAEAQANSLLVIEDIDKRLKSLDRDTALLKAKTTANNHPGIDGYHRNAADDFKALKKITVARASWFGRVAQENQAASLVLRTEAENNTKTAERLGGGVSANTKWALGGAALIAAGTLGGIYYISKKSIDRADKAAENRIRQMEESASRIIILARDSVSSILKDAEKTAERILNKAKDGAVELTKSILGELREEVEYLSERGIAKLREELDELFARLIEKAKTEGKTALVETLTKTRQEIYEFLTKEWFKRKGTSTATSTGTSTNTSTGTSTHTSTSTGTSMATTTAISTGTESATATATGTSSATAISTNSGTSTNTQSGIHTPRMRYGK